MHKKILPFIKKLIKEHDVKIKFIDVGCRNGILELADLAEFIEAHGFEPNPTEYEKLISGTTDALIQCNVKPPNFKQITYHPFALSNKSGEDEFFVTPGPGACGLKEPELTNLERITWKGKRYEKNFGEDIFADYKKIKVQVKTLDSFVADYIDFLKIDVEGSEYEVLEGGRNILLNTGVVKVEVCFIPFRKNQKLFSEVDILLRELGFELLNYEVEPAHIGYKERKNPIFYTPVGFPDPFGQTLSCDAVYVNRNLTDSKRIVAQAAVLLDKNYVDEALYILKHKDLIKDMEFLNLLKTASSLGRGQGQRLRGAGYYLVDRTVEIIKKIFNAFK